MEILQPIVLRIQQDFKILKINNIIINITLIMFI